MTQTRLSMAVWTLPTTGRIGSKGEADINGSETHALCYNEMKSGLIGGLENEKAYTRFARCNSELCLFDFAFNLRGSG